MRRFMLSILVIAMMVMVVGVQAEPILLGTVDKSAYIQQTQAGELDEMIDPDVAGGFNTAVTSYGDRFFIAWNDLSQSKLACFVRGQGEAWRINLFDNENFYANPSDMIVVQNTTGAPRLCILGQGFIGIQPYLFLSVVTDQGEVESRFYPVDPSYSILWGPKLMAGEGGLVLVTWTLWTHQEMARALIFDVEAMSLVTPQFFELDISSWSHLHETSPKFPFFNGAWHVVASSHDASTVKQISISIEAEVTEIDLVELPPSPKATFLFDSQTLRTINFFWGEWLVIDRSIQTGEIVDELNIGPIETTSFHFVQRGDHIAFSESYFGNGGYACKITIISNDNHVSTALLPYSSMMALSRSIDWIDDNSIGNVRVLDGQIQFTSVSVDGQVNWEVPLATYNGMSDGTCGSEVRPDNSGGAWVVWEEAVENPFLVRLYVDHVVPPVQVQPTLSKNTEPEQFSVHPNPFNASTTITVNLPQAGELKANVFNMLGQQVAELANRQFEAGEHQFIFDGSNLSSGTYVIHLNAGEQNLVQRIQLVK